MAGGFFIYLKKLKYDYYLKEPFKQMNVSEDLEKDLDSRGYKYLDDEGSISPIEESVSLCSLFNASNEHAINVSV